MRGASILEQLGSLRGYTSRELDLATGLYFYRARWYDSKLGKFISADPAKFNGGDYSWYRYVGGNPGIYADPNGKNIVAVAIVAVVVALVLKDKIIDFLKDTFPDVFDDNSNNKDNGNNKNNGDNKNSSNGNFGPSPKRSC